MRGKAYHILLCCFDVSADHHGARLLSYLREFWRGKNVVYSMLGGEELRALASGREDMAFLEDVATASTVGLLEGWKEALAAPSLFKKINGFLQGEEYSKGEAMKQKKSWGSVNCFLAIDGQGRNLHLGKIARGLGIRTAYFFPPLIFLWGGWNAKRMGVFDHIFCAFKPNFESYQKRGLRPTLVGHPFSYYELAKPEGGERGDLALEKTLAGYQVGARTTELKKRLGIGAGDFVIGIFPGSRTQEIAKLMPIFLSALGRVRAAYGAGGGEDGVLGGGLRLRFIVALSHENFRKRLEGLRGRQGWGEEDLPIIHGAYEEILACSDFAITCSGTVTLKAAFFRTPHIITYKLSWLSYWIARLLVKGRHIGMFNILRGRTLTKELINGALTSGTLYESIVPYLRDGEKLKRKAAELDAAVMAMEEEFGGGAIGNESGGVDRHDHPFGRIGVELGMELARFSDERGSGP